MASDAKKSLALLEGGGLQPDGLVQLVRDGASVIGESDLPGGGRLEFEATAIRRERSGVHARLAISVDQKVAAFSVFNIERDEDRLRLSNSAGRRIGEGKGDAIKVRLDQFCGAVWAEWIRTDEGTEIGLLDEAAAPQFLLEPYVLREGGTILFAPPGTAKSWTALVWAACLTNADPTAHLPFASDRANVLFVNLERSARSVSWRLGMVAKALGCRPRVIGINRRGSTLADVWEACRATIATQQIDLVIVDSLSRAGYGDLNANDDTNRAMDALNALGCAWVVLAHSPRADASHVFGSVMHDAAADLCVRLTSSYAAGDDKRLGVRLEVTKANDVRKARPAVWEYGFDDTGLVSVGRAREGDYPDLAPAMSVADQVAEVLRDGKSHATQIAAELGIERAAVAQALRRDGRFIKLGHEGKAVMYGLRVTNV